MDTRERFRIRINYTAYISQGGGNIKIKIYNSKERFDYLKQLSREVRELIEEKYPEIYEDEIDFFTKLLELELKHLFLKLGKSK